MRRLLKGYEITGNQLAKYIGCSRNTAYRKLAHPDDFTIAELRLISKRAGIPMEEIRERI